MKKKPTINPNDFVSVESGSEDVYIPLDEEIEVYDVDKALDEINGVVVAGSTGDKVEYLDETKTDIREAIINKGVDVGEDAPFRLYAEKIDDIPTEVHNQDKTIIENGVYTADSGYTGLGEVTVSVPQEEPVLEDITVQVNGVYTADEGYDGLGEVTVDVPQVEPVLETLNVSGNGTYIPSGNVDGYDEVVVDVQPVLEDISVSENGTYTASSGYDGLGEVVVNMPVINNQDKNISQNGTYTADSGYSGLGEVVVDVQPVLEDKTIRVNGTYTAGEGYDGLGEVVVDVEDVPVVVEPLSVSPTTSQQIITPPVNVDGFNQVTVGAVDSSIDSDIVSGNIKSGVSILGVSGSVVEANETTLNVSPTTSAQTFTPTGDYTGFDEVNVNAVDSSIDSNIVAGNIKEGITILGVQGTYQGGPDHYVMKQVVNGVLKTAPVMIDLTGVTDLGTRVFSYEYAYVTWESNTTIDMSALTTISGSFACENMFGWGRNIAKVDMSNVTTISGDYACYNMFYVSDIQEVDLSKLENITGSQACGMMFAYTSIPELSFPALKSTSFGSYTNQFHNMLQGVNGCTVHFPSSLEEDLSQWADVQNGFGGTNTTILWDLTATEPTLVIKD